MRDYKLYLEDILQSAKKIEKYTQHLTFNQFEKNELVIDGVVRNLEIIGEASKNLSQEIKDEMSLIEWQKIINLRNILTHAYFGVDVQILWDIVENKIPLLKKELTRHLKHKK